MIWKQEQSQPGNGEKNQSGGFLEGIFGFLVITKFQIREAGCQSNLSVAKAQKLRSSRARIVWDA